jgi:predicted permease
VIASWQEAYRLQARTYPELAYQSVYAVRQGNVLPGGTPAHLVTRSGRRVIESKLLVSGLLALITLGVGVVLRPGVEHFLAPHLASDLYDATVLSGLLILELALLWWTGIQILPTFLSSGILPTLDTLPVPSKTVERAGLLLFLRLFDLPALTVLILTPLAAAFAFHSAWAGLAMVPGAVAVVVFALALALTTGRFFVRHVQGSPGGAGHAAVRWAYLLLWATPAFAMYGFLTFGPRFVDWMTTIAASGTSPSLLAVFAVFPFPLAAAPGLVAGTVSAPLPGASGVPATAAVVAAIVYAALTVAVAVWLAGAPAAFSRAGMRGRPVGASVISLRPTSAAYAILTKDLRVASRTPGFAFLILLPLLNAVAIGVWTLLSGPSFSDVFNIAAAAVATAALLATFFGPAFFAIEVMGFGYTRTLPLSERSLLLGKVGLITLLYLLSGGIVLGIALLRVFAPGPFVAFIAAELPAVVAAALFELGVLSWVARRRGMPITNLYSGGWWAAAVSVPGLILAGAPLVGFEILRSSSLSAAVLLMAGIGLAELVGVGIATLGGPAGGLR